MPMKGGLKELQSATDEVQQICNAVREELESKLGRTLNEYTARVYRTQLVAGQNFFVKVHVGGDNYLHLRIYRDLKQQISLSSFQEGKLEIDEIEYF